MSYEVMLLVLLAALLHAVWNAIVKVGPHKLLDMAGVTFGAAILAGFGLLFVPAPAVASWPYIAVSVFIHILYFWLVAAAYRTGDLSIVYPIMRGTAPVFTAILAIFLVNEALSPGSWIGIGAISCGILLLAANSRNNRLHPSHPLAFGLLNAGVIVAYTLVDGVGVRQSGSTWGYVWWMFFLNGILMVALTLAILPKEAKRSLFKDQWKRNFVGGACTVGAYGITLWAMTHAPIAMVAALRETSVIFGTIIAALFLKEKFGPLRYLAAALVASGAISLKIF